MKDRIRNPNRRINFISTLFLVLIFFLSPDILFSWDLDPYTYKKKSKWSISIIMGVASGSPKNSMGIQLGNPGFDNSNFTLASVMNSAPRSKFNRHPLLIELKYRTSRLISLGLQYSISFIRQIDGYNNLTLNNSRIGIRPLANVIAMLVSFNLSENIILGFGPTYNIISSPVRESRMGFLAHLELNVPLVRRLSGKLICQYRYIGNMNVGPFVGEGTSGGISPYPSTMDVIVPSTDISYNHLFIGVGVGISIGK
jgi:hypothetical protein